MIEIWKPVIGFENTYEVSNLGRVRSLDMCAKGVRGSTRHIKGKILKASVGNNGYPRVCLAGKNWRNVHRLVAEAFLSNPCKKKEVNHIDGNKSNNAVWNLEWSTRSENQLHAYKTGLDSQKKFKTIQKNMNGVILHVYDSSLEASQKTGILQGNISKCANGKAKTAGGYKWSYLRKEI